MEIYIVSRNFVYRIGTDFTMVTTASANLGVFLALPPAEEHFEGLLHERSMIRSGVLKYKQVLEPAFNGGPILHALVEFVHPTPFFEKVQVEKWVLPEEEKPVQKEIKRVANLDVRRSVILDPVDHTVTAKPVFKPEMVGDMPMPDYMTVLAYTNLKDIKIPRGQIAQAGRDLTKLCKRKKIKFYRKTDDRYGSVNLYPLSVLDDYFAHLTF